MKRLVLFTLLLVTMMPLMAQQRSDAEMEDIARQQLMSGKMKGVKARTPVALKRVHSDQAYAVYTPSSEEGFVIVSRDDRMQPVLGYANGSFDMVTVPCNMKWWFDEVNRTYERLQARGADDGTPDVRATAEPIDIPFTTKWGQNFPYNIQVPVQRAPTGCVAVAMAQLMNYHQWPLSAAFTGAYGYFGESGEVYVNQEVNSRYVWPLKFAYGDYFDENVGKHHSGYEDYTDDEVAQVAQLMRDCGLAVSMFYVPGANDIGQAGADLMTAAYAFPTYFNYSSASIRFHNRLYFSHREWLSIITRELAKGCPVIYGGTPSDDMVYDHVFIVHGIDASGMLLINWGWTGGYDGFYHIDDLTIWDDSEDGSENQEKRYDFTHSHHIITGIRKEVWEGEGFQSEFCMDLLPASAFTYDSSVQPRFSVTVTNFKNYQPLGFVGNIFLAVEEEGASTQYLRIPFSKDVSFSPSYVTYWSKQQLPLNDRLKNGHDYIVYLVTKDNNEEGYTPVRSVGGQYYYTLHVDGQGKGTFDGPVAFEGRFPGDGVKSLKPAVDDGITRVYDLQGRVLYSAPTAAFNIKNVPGRGIVIVKQGDKATKIVH